MSSLNLFTAQLNKLFDELSQLPNPNKEIKFALESYNQMKLSNKYTDIELCINWNNYITKKYTDELTTSKNDTDKDLLNKINYFLNKDYKDDLVGEANTFAKIIDNIKLYLKSLPNNNQILIFKIIQKINNACIKTIQSTN